MRVLSVTNWYPPHHYGGYELLCFDVNRKLAERGHEVAVLCSDHSVPGARPIEAEHERIVRRELRLYWRDETPWSPSLRARVAIERHNQRCLDRAIDEVQPEVVVVGQVAVLSTGLVTSLTDRGIPLVFAVFDDWLTYTVQQDAWARIFTGTRLGRTLGRAVRPLLQIPTTAPDFGGSGAFLFISEATRRTAEAHSPWRYPRAAVVYAGIERSVFADRVEGERPWRWRLLWVGRFDPRKGAATAIRALVHLPPEATLVVSGRGDPAERARLAQLASALGVADRVTLTTTERDDLPRLYASADVFLFPSEWAEPFGLTPLEAMASGTPVVGTASGGSAEFLVHTGNCLVVPPKDPEAIAECVRRLAIDEPLRRRLVEGGSATAERLTTDHLTDEVERWCLAAVGKPTDGQPEVDIAHALHRHQIAAPDVLASGEASQIKQLYMDLGRDWWTIHGDDIGSIPVLSAPETAPVVIARMASVQGLVLDAGCGPNPSVSIGLAADTRRRVVSLDIGWGTVRVARAAAEQAGTPILGVVGDVERLPFRGSAFHGVVCDDTIEHLPDDVTGVAELARVARTSAPVVLATPNRQSADILRAKLRDRLRGTRRPRAEYFVSNSHLREYSWAEFEALVRPTMRLVARIPVGWQWSHKAHVATRFLHLPGMHRFGQMIVVEGRPR